MRRNAPGMLILAIIIALSSISPRGVGASGPEIINPSNSYERGGTAQGVFVVQIGGLDVAHAQVLLDGSDRYIDTIAHTATSVTAKLHDDTPLGRHTLSVQSGALQTSEHVVDIIAMQFAPVGALRTGQVKTVHLSVAGLGNDPAHVVVTVSGAAALANGSTSTTVPVVDGDADVDIRGVRAGQLAINTVLDVEIPHTVERPYGPGYRPPPCSPEITDGWFEPEQGVWQDDQKFDDHPTKQLTRTSAPGDPPAYDAELDMITGRDTLLFGVEHYEYNGAKINAGVHGVIEMSGTTDCSDPPVPVKMQFSFLQGSAQKGKIIWTSEVIADIRLTGHHVAPQPWGAILTGHGDGIPPVEQGPFRIAAFGNYVIQDELIRADTGAGTGLAMTVGGKVHGTASLKIAYVPLLLTPHEPFEAKELEDNAETLGTEAGKYIPDMYPMTPHAIEGWAYDVMDLSKTNVMNPTLDRNSSEFWIGYQRSLRVKAELARRFDLLARESGFQRMVLLLSINDMETIEGKDALGAAVNKKFVLVRQGQTYYTVAHELAHTLNYLWSSPEMIRDCTRPGDYHNTGYFLANGYRVDTANVPGREDKDQNFSFMSYTGSKNLEWIDQCTYWNLAKALSKKPDPAMMLVRGVAYQGKDRTGAFLWPMYDLDGEGDLVAGQATPDEHWRIDVLNDNNAVLASYPFEPQWADENGHIQDLVPIAYEIPTMQDAAAIEVYGPNGYSNRIVFSHTPPALRVVTPVAASVVHASNGTAPVTWNATGEVGRQLLTTVLYSPNQGAAWYQRVFEEPVHSANVNIDPKAKTHWLKIIVTDGTRSTERIVKFRTAAVEAVRF